MDFHAQPSSLCVRHAARVRNEPQSGGTYTVGAGDGAEVGNGVGAGEGAVVGKCVGSLLGTCVGFFVGWSEGLDVGDVVGAAAVHAPRTHEHALAASHVDCFLMRAHVAATESVGEDVVGLLVVGWFVGFAAGGACTNHASGVLQFVLEQHKPSSCDLTMSTQLAVDDLPNRSTRSCFVCCSGEHDASPAVHVVT